MSPLTLIRERASSRHSGIPLAARVTHMRARVVALPHTARPALGILLDTPRRLWLSELAATLCVLGGFVAAPLLTVLAWIGLVMPADAPLHHAAETIFVIAIVWLGLAFVSAHVHHNRHHPLED